MGEKPKLYRVVWVDNGHRGESEPSSLELAEAWAAEMNRLYPDVTHEVELAAE
jgi:hypothetical protein